MSRKRRTLAIALAIALAVLVALEAGLWIRTETHVGPFDGESGNPTVIAPVTGLPFARCCLAARSDDNGALQRSWLRLSVDGNLYPNAHAGHDAIRAGKPGTFSHWTDGVRFALPDGQDNDETAAVQFTYPIQIPSMTASLALIAATALAFVLSIVDILYRGAATAVRRARASIAFAASPVGRAQAKARGLEVLAALRRRRRILAFLLVVAVAAAFAIECGAWERTQVIAGPFAEETGDKMLSVPVDRGSRLLWLLAPRGDIQTDPYRSRLSLTVDEKSYPEAHSIHDPIRKGGIGIFSHWQDEVRFALPSGVLNGPDTRVTLTYPLQFAHPWWIAALLSTATAFWLLLERPWLTSDRVSILLGRPLFTLMGATVATAGLAAAYAAATTIAWIKGWALPSAEPIIRSTAVRWLAMGEPHIPGLVIGFALIGTAAGWLARSRGVNQDLGEARVLRILRIVGLPILFALLIFSVSAQWAGLSREGDLSSMSIAGLLPFSDANGYYADANDVVNDGLFGVMGSRRPIAQVFRTTLMALGNYHYARMIVIQILLLSTAIFAASGAIARRRGVWAGLAFAALSCVAARQFDSTALTESLGLFWSLCAIPPLLKAFEDRSASHALLGVGMLFIALLTRMGSMFTIPALLFWLLTFGNTRAAKLRIAAAGVAVLLGVAALNSTAAKLYTSDAGMVGSNFSYSLCGLTIGGTWSECLQRYQGELPIFKDGDDSVAAKQQQEAQVNLMYRKAYENFRSRPNLFFNRLLDGSIDFLKSIPQIMTQGYQPVPFLYHPTIFIFEIMTLLGLIRFAAQMRGWEAIFWTLFWLSAIASAGFVFFDDGRRVMIAIYPLIGLFFVSGLSTRHSGPQAAMRKVNLAGTATRGALITVAALVACLFVPLIEHRLLRPSIYLARDTAGSATELRRKNERYTFGSSRMAGLLVVADGSPLPMEVPAMHISDFAEIMRRSGIEHDYQKLLTPTAPAVPFAFVEAPELVPGRATYSKLIAPPDILLRRDVPAWHFETVPMPMPTDSPSFFFQVVKAEPISASDKARAAVR